MDVKLNKKLIKKLSKEHAKVKPRWEMQKRKGVMLEEFLIGELHGNNTEVPKKIIETCTEYYEKLSNAQKSQQSASYYLRAELADKTKDMTNEECHSYYSFIRRISMRTTFEAYEDVLLEEGYDSEFIRDVIEEEHRVNEYIAKTNPTETETDELLEETIEAMENSILFVKPEFVNEPAQDLLNYKDIAEFAQGINDRIIADNEHQILCSFIVYKGVLEGQIEIEGIPSDSPDPQLIAYFISAGCAYEASLKQAALIEDEQKRKQVLSDSVQLITAVTLLCISACLYSYSVAGVVTLPLVSTYLLVILASIAMGTVLLFAGTLAIEGISLLLDSDVRNQIKEKFLSTTARIISWVQNKAVPVVKRKFLAMASWVKSKVENIKVFFCNMKRRVASVSDELYPESVMEIEDLDAYVTQHQLNM